MKNKSAPSVEGSSENSTTEATGQLLTVSPLTLEAAYMSASLAYHADSPKVCRENLRELMQLLEQLIKRSESEEEAIYEWASGQ